MLPDIFILVNKDFQNSKYHFILWNFIEHISCPYKPRSRDLTLIFGPLDMCIVNHRPPVGLCLDSNEDRGGGESISQIWIKWQSGLENVTSFLSRAYGTLSSLNAFTIYIFQIRRDGIPDG